MKHRIFAAALLALAVLMPFARAQDVSGGRWSETDSSNTNWSPPAAGVYPGWPANMKTTDVEPSARAMMGALKRWWDRENCIVTTTGSAGAYAYATTNATFPSAYATGEVFCGKANFASVGNDTLAINALGAKNIYRIGSSGAVQISANDIPNNGYFIVAYDSALNSAAGGFQLIDTGVTDWASLVNVNALIVDLNGMSLSQGDVLYYNGTHLVRLPAGSNGQFLQTLGAGQNPNWAAAGSAVSSVTVYATHIGSPFTWTKPAGISGVLVRVCGAGGGGAGSTAISSTLSGGGGGAAGSCNEDFFRAADIGATVSVTIGQGGTGGANSGSGTANGSGGSNTTFGSLLTGYAGGGGSRSSGQNVSGGGGGSGGLLGAGGSVVTSSSGGTAGSFGGVTGANSNAAGASPSALPWIGASGGGADDTANGHAGGASVFGPGGGAGAGNAASTSPKNGAAGGVSNLNAGGLGGTSGTPNGGNGVAVNPCEGGSGGGSGWSSGSGTTPGTGGAGIQGSGGGGAGGGFSGTGAVGGSGGDGFACIWVF